MAEKGIDGSLLGSGRDGTDFLGTERGGTRWNMMFQTVWGRNMAEHAERNFLWQNGRNENAGKKKTVIYPGEVNKQYTAH